MTDRPSVRPSWVLLVDDDKALCRTLERALRRWGYEPMVAESGQEALDLCGAGMPAVAIVDIMMPGMDGWLVTKHLVRRGGAAAPKIVLISAGFTKEEIHPPDAIVVASLPKPIDLKRFHEVVEGAWHARLRVKPPAS